MCWAIGLGLLQWAVAFLVLDLTFRLITVDPTRLGSEIKLWRRRFGLLAAAFCLAGGVLQVWLAGVPGVATALLGPLPWWILWRFGWRKQFTFLYLHDGGKDWKGNEPGL